eukprot:GILI01011391.1.p1 GENE.GILI01011391.1~~GILI01011391.1.p1  ORF type:complete len:315 (+),score=50.30 GILI01011391.1:219-1163(+)
MSFNYHLDSVILSDSAHSESLFDHETLKLTDDILDFSDAPEVSVDASLLPCVEQPPQNFVPASEAVLWQNILKQFHMAFESDQHLRRYQLNVFQNEFFARGSSRRNYVKHLNIALQTYDDRWRCLINSHIEHATTELARQQFAKVLQIALDQYQQDWKGQVAFQGMLFVRDESKLARYSEFLKMIDSDHLQQRLRLLTFISAPEAVPISPSSIIESVTSHSQQSSPTLSNESAVSSPQQPHSPLDDFQSTFPEPSVSLHHSSVSTFPSLYSVPIASASASVPNPLIIGVTGTGDPLEALMSTAELEDITENFFG